ncbi:MAG TPA: hypothetical protein VFW87_11430 [Pirellulales bacterium]|nr:hypothetical protein [Pirellulales bacterium]
MLDDDAAALLQRLREETATGRLVWAEDADGCFVAHFGPEKQQILIRRMFFEATNQIGADPYFVELSMPFWNARFTITEDSDGWRAIRDILNAAFPGGWESGAARAIRHLEMKMSTRPDTDDRP